MGNRIRSGEARSVAEAALAAEENRILEVVYGQIRGAALAGKFSTSFDDPIPHQIRQMLAEDGYVVRVYHGVHTTISVSWGSEED